MWLLFNLLLFGFIIVSDGCSFDEIFEILAVKNCKIVLSFFPTC